MAAEINCQSVVVPPADCGGQGTLVPQDCTCNCNAGYYNDLTVGAGRKER
jgi:hypothetical protein